jgi:hypothetical protein
MVRDAAENAALDYQARPTSRNKEAAFRALAHYQPVCSESQKLIDSLK